MGRKTKPVNTEALEKLDIYNHNGVNLSEHTTVELDDKDFLRIVCVLQSSKTGAVFVHGHRFRRTQYMHGMFDDNCNEVCWIQELDEDDCRPSEVQSMHTATATQVVKQRELYLANRSCPTLSRCEQSLTDETDPVQKEALRQNIENNAPLTCRMKYIRYFKNARARRKKAFYEEAVCFLLARECDEKSNSISSDDLRQLWRGSTERGGAQLGMEPGEKEFLRQEEISHAGRTCRNSLIIAGRKYEHRDIMTRGTVGDLFIRGEGPDAGYCKLSGIDDKCFAASTLKVKTIEEASETQTEKEMSSEGLHGGSIDGKSFHTEDSRPRKKTRLLQSPEMMEGDSDRRIPQKMEMRTKDSRRYTFGDCFCGVGGMSRGAVMAGLRVKWGFDYNDNACYTYALNFVNALVYHEQAYLFATLKANHKVDICHMSTPCQYFSIAHNRVGRNDEENLASFFAVGDLLRKTKCRVAVLEQVPGLVRRRRHEVYFHACVRQFAENGFSVRWRVLNCANFGLPQRRERLFMIASWYTSAPSIPIHAAC